MEENNHRQMMDEAMRAIDETPPPKKTRGYKKWLKVAGLAVLLIIICLVGWRLFIYEAPPAAETPIPTATEPEPVAEETPEEAPVFDKAALQKVLTQWGASTSGTYGVTITDEDGKVLAQTNSNKTYFTASIYKLYVAYIGYQKIDDGTYTLSEPYLSGWTRGKCLDEMIRTSHSPCAEKMWAELGKENLTNTLKTYGLKNTSMTGLTTSSGDAAIVLARIARGEDLSKDSRKAFMASMGSQIYRDALPAGFTQLKIYDKVGFRGQDEYHDTAIVRTKDGRYLTVSVLTSGVGTKKIAALATSLEDAVQ